MIKLSVYGVRILGWPSQDVTAAASQRAIWHLCLGFQQGRKSTLVEAAEACLYAVSPSLLLSETQAAEQHHPCVLVQATSCPAQVY